MNLNDSLKKQVPELLSPAGGTESFIAAVQNGADAVYMGLSSFNARASAQNFTTENLAEHISYAHVRGVKVYITLNTLVKTSELANAISLAREADCAGADAFIVQDLGLASRLGGKIKAPLHASTQASVYNIEGLRKIKELGFTRAVLARELSLNEIAELSSAQIMETEVFCHGALCMSYSGQCMLSRFTSGRSGNRGTCSQPCRLKYSLLTDKEKNFSHLLSPSDLCSLSYMRELIGTGVSSLKIEGRLKSPEYTSAVTRIYRKIIDNPQALSQDDIDDLTVIFSRGGFCSGHQLGKMPLSAITWTTPGKTGLPAGKALGNAKTVKGPVSLYEIEVSATKTLQKGDGITFNADSEAGGVLNVIKVSGAVTDSVSPNKTATLLIAGKPPYFKNAKSDRGFYKTYDAKLYAELKKSFAPGAELKKVPLKGVFTISDGSPASFTLSDREGRKVTVYSREIAKQATSAGKGLDSAVAESKLSAFGGTPFILNEFEFIGEEGLFIGFSELKAMRRSATEKMIAERAHRILTTEVTVK